MYAESEILICFKLSLSGAVVFQVDFQTESFPVILAGAFLLFLEGQFYVCPVSFIPTRPLSHVIMATEEDEGFTIIELPVKNVTKKQDKKMPDGRVCPDHFRGWLLKWTNYIKGYQRRWFVLSNGLLSYYRYRKNTSIPTMADSLVIFIFYSLTRLFLDIIIS